MPSPGLLYFTVVYAFALYFYVYKVCFAQNTLLEND